MEITSLNTISSDMNFTLSFLRVLETAKTLTAVTRCGRTYVANNNAVRIIVDGKTTGSIKYYTM